MKEPEKKRANAIKRLLAGIIFVIIGVVLIKIISILAWVMIIIGGILVFAGVGKVSKINQFLDEVEKEVKIEKIAPLIKKPKIKNSSGRKKNS